MPIPATMSPANAYGNARHSAFFHSPTLEVHAIFIRAVIISFFPAGGREITRQSREKASSSLRQKARYASNTRKVDRHSGGRSRRR